MADQRSGPLSKLLYIEEEEFNKDTNITAHVASKWPLADRSGVTNDQNMLEVRVFDGTRESLGAVSGQIASAGNIPTFLDSVFIGRMLKAFFGTDRYQRVGNRHRWMLGTTMGSGQLQGVSTETPPLYWRFRGHRVSDLEFAGAEEGPVRYNVRTIGSGSESDADFGGDTDTSEFDAFSYLDGRIALGSSVLASVTEFACNLHNNLSRQNTFFNAGIATAINVGKYGADGRLGLQLIDRDFYNYAKDGVYLNLDAVWCNAPVEALPPNGPSKYLRIVHPAVRFGRVPPQVGGDSGLIIGQGWRNKKATAGLGAEIWFGNPPPYTIAASGTLDFLITGHAQFSVTLVTGERTTDQIISDLNSAFATNGNVAVATNFLGRPLITSTSLGSAATAACVTTPPNSQHVECGLTSSVYAGVDPTSVMVELVNGLSEDY